MSTNGVWFEMNDPHLKQKYYLNSVTKETTWILPSDVIAVPMPQQEEENGRNLHKNSERNSPKSCCEIQ